MLIYVSGPYTAPTLKRREEHVAKAIEAGRELLNAGAYPMIPHLNHLYSRHLTKRGEKDLTHEEYLAWDEEILKRCDGLLKLADSPGADHEEKVALDAGLPVFHTVAGILHWKDCVYCQRHRKNCGDMADSMARLNAPVLTEADLW